eukprot:g664.t1
MEETPQTTSPTTPPPTSGSFRSKRIGVYQNALSQLRSVRVKDDTSKCKRKNKHFKAVEEKAKEAARKDEAIRRRKAGRKKKNLDRNITAGNLRLRQSTPANSDREIIDDLFGDLDASMRVESTTSTARAQCHLKRKPPASSSSTPSLPVAMADADGKFTSKGMEKLVVEAKIRRLREAKLAKEKRAREQIEAAKRAKLDAERKAAEMEAKKIARREAEERRAAHRKTRSTALNAETLEANADERCDELEALESMYGDDDGSFVKQRSGGEGADSFSLAMCDGALDVSVSLPRTYPSSSPPHVSLKWNVATNSSNSASTAAKIRDMDLPGLLEDMWMRSDGCVVLFEWIEAARERVEESGVL